jgi:uncharacterized protein
VLKWILLSALLIVSSSSNVFAQDTQPAISEEKRALIKELLEVVDVKTNVNALFNAMVEEQEKSLPDILWEAVAAMPEVKRLNATDQRMLKAMLVKDAVRIAKRVRELFQEKIDLSRLLEDISFVAYDKYFNEAQLRDLIAFYRSPTGKRTIEVMPQLFTESMTMTMQAVRPRIGDLMNDLMKEESEHLKQTVAAYKPKSPKPSARRSAKP